MCGFIACRDDALGTDVNIARRGEDGLSYHHQGGYTFFHSLLHMTGERTTQPFVDGDIVCVYNGEIYNAPSDLPSDGCWLIPLYKEFGPTFPQMLDGEFAIALFDFAKGIAVYSTDAFRCKPIFVNCDGAASYASGLKHASRPLPMNTILVRDLNSHAMWTHPVHTFKFDEQCVDTYDKWIYAFEYAVLKRTRGQRSFFGLSSGYDSGAIDLARLRMGANARPYSILGGENEEILRARNEPMPFDKKAFERARDILRSRMEDYAYEVFGYVRNLWHEESAFAMAHIMMEAKDDGLRVYLSGTGGDEIISDYSTMRGQSEFHGRFPENLSGPWRNFYGECMDAYLAKEEHVGGAFAVETRYPFLDVGVVQEFLWLTPELKNQRYKAPIAAYLERHGYPFAEEKRGFGPQRGFDS